MKQEFQDSDSEEYIRNTLRSLHNSVPELIIDLTALKQSALKEGSINKPITYLETTPGDFLQCLLHLRQYIEHLPELLKSELRELISPLSVFLYHELRQRQRKEVYIDFLAKVVKKGILQSEEEVNNTHYFNTKHVLVLSQFGYNHLVDFVTQQKWLSVLSILNQHFVIDLKQDSTPKFASQTEKSALQKACDIVDLGIGTSSFSFIKSFRISNNCSILAMKFSSDNKTLLAACDSIIYKFAPESPTCKRDIKLYKDEEFSFSVDEESGQKYTELRGHSGPVYWLDINSDGRYALSASFDSTVILWDLHVNEAVCKYEGHGKWPVFCVQFSPVTPYFCTTSGDTTAKLWRTDKIEPLRIFCGHDSAVTQAAFHPNGSYVFTVSEDMSCRMWAVACGRCVRVMSNKSQITSLCVSPNGKHVVCTLVSGTIAMWDIATTKILRQYQLLSRTPSTNGYSSHSPTRAVINFSSFVHNNTLVTGDSSGNVLLWDTRLHSKLHGRPIKQVQLFGNVLTMSTSVAGVLVAGMSS